MLFLARYFVKYFTFDIGGIIDVISRKAVSPRNEPNKFARPEPVTFFFSRNTMLRRMAKTRKVHPACVNRYKFYFARQLSRLFRACPVKSFRDSA